MSATADLNPNFVSAEDDSRELSTLDVLPDIFEAGMVTATQEDVAAARWEEDHNRAVLRTWEIAQVTRTKYKERKRHYDAKREAQRKPKLSMDADVAKDELARLMRAPDPSEHATTINELRTEVLGIEPLDFAPAPPPEKIERDKGMEMTDEQVRQKKFLDIRSYREQEKAVAVETDVAFLEWITSCPAARIMPVVKRAAYERIDALKKG